MKKPFELRVVSTVAGDPRVQQTRDLAAKLLEAFNASGCDRDILTSAIGLVLAQMFVSAGAPEDFARFVVGEQLVELVVANMPIVRAALERTKQ